MLSLKAELLRKHEEVSKAKSSHIVDNFIPRKHSEKITKPKNALKTNSEHTKDSISYEDSEMLNRSKKVLEAKSKFYDKMSAMGGSLNSDENCLVMFNQKKQSGNVKTFSHEPSESSSDDSETESNNKEESGEWVEYVDCLGRTRKCLKEDVEFFKKKDGELAETVAERNKTNGVNVRYCICHCLGFIFNQDFLFRPNLLNGLLIQKAISSYQCEPMMPSRMMTP